MTWESISPILDWTGKILAALILIPLGILTLITLYVVFVERVIPWIRHSTSRQPVYGWRLWRVVPSTGYPEGGLIESLAEARELVLRGVHGHVWDGGIQEAKCHSGHSAPHLGCMCGLYAMKVSPLLFRELEANMGAPYVIWGRVAMFGEVIEHEFGYRASKAEIVELAVVAHDRQSLATPLYAKTLAMVEEFGVPVSVYDYGDFVNELRMGEGLWT